MADDPPAEVTLTPDQQAYLKGLDAIKETIHNITTTFSEAVTPAFTHLQESLSKVAFPPLTQSQVATPADIAKAFDVPLELVAPTCVNQVKKPEPEKDLPVYDLKLGPAVLGHAWNHDWDKPVAHLGQDDLAKLMKVYDESHPLTGHWDAVHWDNPASDPVGDIKAAVEKMKMKLPTPPLSNHSWGLAMDLNTPEGKPIPGEMYLEGDGDPGSSAMKISFNTMPQSFDVLGKAQPVAVSMAQPQTIWENDLGRLKIENGRAFLNLTGTVSTAEGMFQLGAELITLDIEFAKKMIGMIPNDGPGTGVQVLEQAAGNQLFTWEAGTGWIPKAPIGQIYAQAKAEAEFLGNWSVNKGGIKFPSSWPSKVSGWPEDGAQHTGPDGAVWEFHTAGGWRVINFEAQLADGKIGRAPYGWFCTICTEHWTVHKGDPAACESGGWLRPATSAEHKRALLAKA